jgi:hypothetical protein
MDVPAAEVLKLLGKRTQNVTVRCQLLLLFKLLGKRTQNVTRRLKLREENSKCHEKNSKCHTHKQIDNKRTVYGIHSL